MFRKKYMLFKKETGDGGQEMFPPHPLPAVPKTGLLIKLDVFSSRISFILRKLS